MLQPRCHELPREFRLHWQGMCAGRAIRSALVHAGKRSGGSSNINLATGATGVTVLGVVTAIHLVEECYTAPSSVSSIGD